MITTAYSTGTSGATPAHRTVEMSNAKVASPARAGVRAGVQKDGRFLSSFVRPGIGVVAAIRVWVILLVAAFSSFCASAHDVGLSTADVRCGVDSLVVDITVAVKDMETDFGLDSNKDGKVTPEEFSSSQEAVERYLMQACLLQVNGEDIQPTSVGSSVDATNNVNLSLSFPVSVSGQVKVRFDLITDMPQGHRMFVAVLDRVGAPIKEQLLTQNSPEITFPVGRANEASVSSQLPSFFGFIKLGVEHIGTGYDHLLFLFALLLVTKNFRSSVAVITFFTLAHSVTLAGATFNLVNLPARITEPLIAATIVYVGLENIWRKGDPHGRWALTFCFGLVHGFGFASVLREMGVGGHAGGVAMPLLGFNIGVELGQLAVAAILLPLIWKLRVNPLFVSRIVPACSAGVVALGGYWLMQRL